MIYSININEFIYNKKSDINILLIDKIETLIEWKFKQHRVFENKENSYGLIFLFFFDFSEKLNFYGKFCDPVICTNYKVFTVLDNRLKNLMNFYLEKNSDLEKEENFDDFFFEIDECFFEKIIIDFNILNEQIIFSIPELFSIEFKKKNIFLENYIEIYFERVIGVITKFWKFMSFGQNVKLGSYFTWRFFNFLRHKKNFIKLNKTFFKMLKNNIKK